jgi:hypothetical protein
LPTAILASLAGILIAQPVGTLLQSRLTTEGNPRGLEIHSVHTWARGGRRIHRIRTYG